MLRKIVLGTALTGGTAVLLLGSSAFSYVRTGVHTIRHEVKSQIPVDVELARCRDMIRQITPEIADNLHAIAREEVEITKLQREVEGKQDRLVKAKSHIIHLRDDLAQDRPHYVYRGRSYDADQVRCDLSNRFKAYKSQQENVDQLTKILATREQKLAAAQQNLERMVAAKRQLEVEVETLQARLMMVQVAESAADLQLDSSQLSRTQELIDEISTRIDVAEKLAGDVAEPLGAIPLDEPQSEDVLGEVISYFDTIDARQSQHVSADRVEDEALTDL